LKILVTISIIILLFLMYSCNVELENYGEMSKASIIIYPQDDSKNIPTIPKFIYITLSKTTEIYIADNKEDLKYPIKSDSVIKIGPVENNEDPHECNILTSPKRLKSNTTYYWRYVNIEESNARYVSEIYKFTTVNTIINATLITNQKAGITTNDLIYTINDCSVSIYTEALEKVAEFSLSSSMDKIIYFDGSILIGISGPSIVAISISENKLMWYYTMEFSNGSNIIMYRDKEFLMVMPNEELYDSENLNTVVLLTFSVNGEFNKTELKLSSYFNYYDSIHIYTKDDKIYLIISSEESNSSIVATISKENLSKISEKTVDAIYMADSFFIDFFKGDMYTLSDDLSLKYMGKHENLVYGDYVPDSVYLFSCIETSDGSFVCYGKNDPFNIFAILSNQKISKMEVLSKSTESQYNYDFHSPKIIKVLPNGKIIFIFKDSNIWEIFSITDPSITGGD